jgi:glutamate 5-kinase
VSLIQTHSETAQTPLAAARIAVVKVGSRLLVDPDTKTAHAKFLSALAADIAALRAQGKQVVVVSSGAVALGAGRLLGMSRPKTLDEKQACAAAGQSALMHAWEDALAPYGAPVAQILLTLHDTEDRRRWLNARATMERLLALGACPIVNENDTVATDEIRYGDNDRLAARVAQMLAADALVLLTDVEGLYTANPSEAGAEFVAEVGDVTDEVMAMAGGAGSVVGSGGMKSKLEAARIAASAGCATAIAAGWRERPLLSVAEGGRATWVRPSTTPATARKAWIASALKPAGKIRVDDGAVKALKAGKSLLPAGVAAVEGVFEKGAVVTVIDMNGTEIGRGLMTISAAEARRVAGRRSDEIAALIGYDVKPELIHRNDLVMRGDSDAGF